MAGNGEQPRQERARAGVEQAGPPPERHEGVLDDLCGHLTVAQESGHRPEHEARMTVIGDHERTLIARGDPRSQSRVVEGRRLVERRCVVGGHPPSVVRTGRWSAPIPVLSSGGRVERDCRPAQ
jgi:hypothetical protein